jgi:mono/diheme cytochrome c family protein
MRLLALIGALAIAAAVAGAVYFFAGFFSVAATVEDPGIVNRALIQVRQASIARQATETPPGSLDEPAIVQAGARAFAERGCVACHGAPGVPWAKFSEGMRPYPPNLKELATQREARELFWVIKNGIKMTGMPGFSLIKVDDKEIWSIVAFVRKLPTVSEADYKSWTTAAPAPGG